MDVAKQKRLQALINGINKKDKSGRQLIARASDVPNPYSLRRPSGIAQLDIDCGGGLPAGACSYLSGPDGAGKTFLLWRYYAMQQKLYGSDCCIAHAAIESAPDLFFARKCGFKVAIPDEMIAQKVRMRKEQGLPAFTKDELRSFKEEVGYVTIIRGDTGESVMDTVLDVFESKDFNMIGVDSVSALIPEGDAEKGIEDASGQQGAQASLMGKFARRFYSKTTSLNGLNPTSLVMVSQVRANRKKSEAASFMAKFIDDFAAMGSYEMKHVKMLDILVTSGSYDKEEVKAIEGMKARVSVGKVLKWRLLKGKVGTHEGIHGETELNFDRPWDSARSLVIAGVRYKVLQLRDDKVSVDGTDIQKMPIEEFVERIQKDFGFELQLKQRINGQAGVECVYT